MAPLFGRNEDISVLVVEDDFLVSKELERSLKAKGFRIIGNAATGVQAIELTTRLRPDLVLMDISMPGMDGIEASKRIQESCPTPIVIVTAHETADLLEKASMAGVGAYLVKPPSPDDLERGIIIARARHQDLMRLRQQMEEIKTLRGIIPICCFCKKIRDDRGYWEQVEKYVADHTEALFSHGICPECSQKYYPDLPSSEKNGNKSS